MPIKYSEYPANWKTEIVPTILRRAGEERDASGRILVEARCEWCGAPNHTHIVRAAALYHKPVEYAGLWKTVPVGDYKVVEPTFPDATRVVLTTAHLDRDKTNNALDNLASLCQRCHLNHDRWAQHLPNRKYGRGHSRQEKLF